MSGWWTPPGWYPDPSDTSRWRWWNGWAWTETTAVPIGGDSAVIWQGEALATVPSGLRERLTRERRLGRWARWTAVVAGLVQVLDLAVVWLQSSAWKRYFRAFADFDPAFPSSHSTLYPGSPTTRWSLPPGSRLLPNGTAVLPHGAIAVPIGAGNWRITLPPLPVGLRVDSLVSLLALASFLLFLVWQFRAASMAKALRYPARHSPGWGLGAWFVPVVNLWIPYAALRDCLPPGHRLRARAWVPWVMYLLNGLVVPAAYVVLVVDRPVGVILGVLAAAMSTYVGVAIVRWVDAVGEGHRQTVESAAARAT